MKIFGIAVLLASWFLSLQAQGLFPLQVGNIWQYSSAAVMNPDPPLESRIIGDTLLSNGKHYSILTGLTFGTSFLRQEGYKVYGYDWTDSAEYVLLDFTANKNDTLSHHKKGQRTIVAGGKTPFSTPSSTYWYFYERAGTGSGSYIFYNWTIRDSVGLTAITIEPGNSWNLSGALVNGKQIGVITGIHSSSSVLPTVPILKQNYPNPFNPATIIQIILGASSHLRLSVFNTLGQEVSVIANGQFSIGSHAFAWDASNFPSGIYFYQLVSGNLKETKKMLLIR